MTEKRMKSDQVRREFADVLQFVRTGGTVIVEHYNKPIAAIVPLDRIKETAVIATDITATIERPADEFASDWNWADAATDAWLAAAEAAGLDVASWSTDVRHPDSEAAIVTVNTGAKRRDEVPGAIVISDVTAEYALEVHGDEVRAIPVERA